MIQIIEILPDERAVVSTRGLMRVIDLEDGEVIQELVDAAEAASLVKGMGCRNGNPVLAAIPYVA